MKLSLISIFVLLTLSFSACGGITPIPTGPLPTHTTPAPDDIMLTPGGGAYRANVYETGKTNPWPPVPVGMNTWTKDSRTIAVFYRTDIEAKPGEAHTDIIIVTGDDFLDPAKNKLVFYAAGVPKGLTITDAAQPMGSIGTLGTVLVITAAPDIAPGVYTVQIGVVLDGQDFGNIPCKVTVVA
jgi:hypothetical protein